MERYKRLLHLSFLVILFLQVLFSSAAFAKSEWEKAGEKILERQKQIFQFRSQLKNQDNREQKERLSLKILELQRLQAQIKEVFLKGWQGFEAKVLRDLAKTSISDEEKELLFYKYESLKKKFSAFLTKSSDLKKNFQIFPSVSHELEPEEIQEYLDYLEDEKSKLSRRIKKNNKSINLLKQKIKLNQRRVKRLIKSGAGSIPNLDFGAFKRKLDLLSGENFFLKKKRENVEKKIIKLKKEKKDE